MIFGSYDFGDLIDEFDYNFADGAPQTRRIPGVDGGFSDLGDEAAETPPGSLTLGFWLVADTRSEMDALRDEVRALEGYGLQRFDYTSLDGALGTRHCFARVTSTRMSRIESKHTNLHQKVSLTFEVPDARWHQDHYTSWGLDDGFILSDGKTVGEGALETAVSGVETTFSVTQPGTALAIPAISVMPGVGESCENPKVQRIANGLVADEIAYTGTLSAGDELMVDGKRMYAALNGGNAFGPDFYYRYPSLFRLQPGPNLVRVRFANSGDAATIRFWFEKVYR